MDINFENASFKDFENIEGLDAYQRAKLFNAYLDHLAARGRLNYRLPVLTASGPEVTLKYNGETGRYISLVSSDYLGFGQHPKVKVAAIEGIMTYGTGTGASPAIGGHLQLHEQLEQRAAAFYHRESAIVYSSGFAANTGALQCLLRREDIAILDMEVHASIFDGCALTNVKRFLHNDLADLERILASSAGQYRMRLVVIDGVYSQNGDLPPLDRIVALVRQYGAYLMIDDAHGAGVIGDTGRGVMEQYQLFSEVDIISGTFSKTFAHVGGYVVASPELVRYLKFQSRPHLFSVSLPPSAAGILKAIDLLDGEPEWMEKLWDNVRYFKTGLTALGMEVGNTASAIIPVKIGDPAKTGEAGRLLLEAGVYANPIMYPAVSRKDARIRMSLMATHTREHLDKVLNAFEWVDQRLHISKPK